MSRAMEEIGCIEAWHGGWGGQVGMVKLSMGHSMGCCGWARDQGGGAWEEWGSGHSQSGASLGLGGGALGMGVS